MDRKNNPAYTLKRFGAGLLLVLYLFLSVGAVFLHHHENTAADTRTETKKQISAAKADKGGECWACHQWAEGKHLAGTSILFTAYLSPDTHTVISAVLVGYAADAINYTVGRAPPVLS